MDLQPHQDPDHPHNGAEHHTGKQCIEKDCCRPAGTWWSPHWCHPCNVVRMDRISTNLNEECRRRGIEPEAT